MTSVKTVGLALLWGLRWGLFLLWPPLLWLAIAHLSTPPETETRIIIPGLTALAFYIGLRCDLAFPGQRQNDNPPLRRFASGIFAAYCICLAITLGSLWLYAIPVAQSNFVGATLSFANEDVLTLLWLLAAFLSLVLFILLMMCLVLGFAQLRLLGWFMTLSFGLFLLLITVVTQKDATQWHMKQTLTGADGTVYSFLSENHFTGFLQDDYKTQYSTALVRRTGGSIFIKKVRIILLDTQTQNPHGALLQGTKHKDANVRQVSEKLLKAQGED